MSTVLIFLLLIAPVAVAEPGSIFDVLDMTIFDGGWSVVGMDAHTQDRCNFPEQWYLITGVVVRHDGGDLHVKTYGVKWNGCRSHKDHSDIGSSTIYNHSDWCEKVYYPYVVTEGVWNAQPQYAKDVLNNTTKFMGVVHGRWYNWHPYLGRPNDMPVNEVSHTEHIFGWLTIAFENASIINGTMYVANACNIVPIYDVWNSVDGIKRYERCEDCESCEDMYACLISVETTETIIDEGDTVRVDVDVVLKWGYYCWNCWPMNQPCRVMWMNTTETATFTATAKAPSVLSIDDNNVFARITMYNNTFDPYSLIQVDVPENITVTTFKYKNNTAKHFNSVGVSNVSHVEYIDAGMWKTTPNQDMILPYGDLCLIRDAPLNLSDLQIQISTPYTTENVTNCTITIITGTAADYINFKCMFVYIIMVSLCLLCAGLNVRRFHL